MTAISDKKLKMKHRSREITEGPDRAPARSYLWAMGLKQEDMDKPFVAIANLASDVTPCNVHLDRFAQAAKEGIRQAEGPPSSLAPSPLATEYLWALRE